MFPKIALSFLFFLTSGSALSHKALDHTIVKENKALRVAIEAVLSGHKIIKKNLAHGQTIPFKPREHSDDVKTVIDTEVYDAMVTHIQENFNNDMIFSQETLAHLKEDTSEQHSMPPQAPSEAIIVTSETDTTPKNSATNREQDSQISEIVSVEPKSEYVWMIDPIDSTILFLHRHSEFAITLAVLKDNNVYCSVIMHPKTNNIYYALRGKGAFLNGKTIKVSKNITLKQSIVSLKLPQDKTNLKTYWPILNSFLKSAQRVFIEHSTALDLAYLAAGHIDVYTNISAELSPYALLAGSLLIQEAGGLVLSPDFHRIEDLGHLKFIIAGNSKNVLFEVQDILRTHKKND